MNRLFMRFACSLKSNHKVFAVLSLYHTITLAVSFFTREQKSYGLPVRII